MRRLRAREPGAPRCEEHQRAPGSLLWGRAARTECRRQSSVGAEGGGSARAEIAAFASREAHAERVPSRAKDPGAAVMPRPSMLAPPESSGLAERLADAIASAESLAQAATAHGRELTQLAGLSTFTPPPPPRSILKKKAGDHRRRASGDDEADGECSNCLSGGCQLRSPKAASLTLGPCSLMP